ncbi:cytochrome c maturation protein CcmE [Paraburkholderia sp. CNPSo 3157]|uniref:Cytochrome c-type biogenesis protein CcmE n=1 Tax=Paraburkholderia franconis TaxID=2654983 RepID=A0A7X1TL82_9BURK|nr:cytochrome c maturation protein CcmE [Paraburkholderia franconis]MPW23366.1 cytochrome c maturation protein CcmE [Paraburkholderia franconis]
MTPSRKKRLYWMLALLCGVSAAAAFAMAALRQNINLFYTPSQIAAGEAPRGTRIRAGGLVEAGSLKRMPGSLALRFIVTDGEGSILVRYEGILPDLFREGQGIVALGRIEPDGSLHADEVLAKHDEKYMPPEAMGALKKIGASSQLPRGMQESYR